MANPMQLKIFSYDQQNELNEFIKTVDLPEQGAITLKDQGICVFYREKRDHFGLTKEEQIADTTDEIAMAEAELADAIVGLRTTELAYAQFKGKSGMKKLADAFLKQSALDQDTVDNKRAKVESLRMLVLAIQSGEIKVGKEAVDELFAKIEQERADVKGQDIGLPPEEGVDEELPSNPNEALV